MFLKRLDLQGFKSFPEKVKLEFHPGITAVVGPNGSGKSNVSDAVRWVLGEQRAKELRGDKMEDVIFAGTETRKPLGFAEVTMVLDNSDGRLPVDYTEVQVTRRVYRSGENEYYLNGTSCRLKDIRELFMDTGIGREGYSIIGQGRIDEILSSKSEERRKIFEEAAGIIKFKTRKKEALIKLEREEQNLLRVEDIITELESRIEPLERESKIAKEYLACKEQLKHAEISMFCTDADRLEKNLEDFTMKIRISQEQMEQALARASQKREEAAALRKASEAETERIQQLNDAVSAAATEIEKTEGAIRLAEEQNDTLTKTISRLEGEKTKRQEKITSNTEELRVVKSKMNAVRLLMEEEQKKLADLEAKHQALGEKVDAKGERAESFKDEIFEEIRRATEAKGEISKREAMQQSFLNRKKQLAEEKSLMQGRQDQQKVHLAAVEKQEADAKRQQSYLERDIAGLENDCKEAQEQAAALEAKQNRGKIAFSETNSRLKLLTELEKEHEGFYGSVKAVLSWQEKENHGICGAVGQLLKVEEAYEVAIEAALGGALQHIVTETEEDAKAAIRFLKERKQGRATFLPLTAVRGSGLEGRQPILSERAVIGTAADLVEYDARYKGIVTYLLGRIVVVDGLDAAVALAKKYHHSYKMVTTEGDIMNPGGSMTGGSMAKKNTNIFGRSREIRTLQEQSEKIAAALQTLEERLAETREDLEDSQNTLLERKMGLQKHLLEMQNLAEEKERTAALVKEQEEKLRLIAVEESQIASQLEMAEAEMQTQRDIISKAEAAVDQANAELEKFQSDLEAERNEKDALSAKIMDCRISISGNGKTLLAHEDQVLRLQKENKTLQEEITALEAEQVASGEGSAAKQEEKEVLRQKAEDLRAKQEELQASLREAAQNRNHLSAAVSAAESSVLEASEESGKLKNELYRLETNQERTALERDNLFEKLWEEYEFTYQMAKEYAIATEETYGQLKAAAKELRNRIKAMGDVNVNAISQYQEVKERYTFLTTQREDIRTAQEKLEEIIRTLSEQMEDQFTKQFAVISDNFSRVFSEMFGGGKAYLKLSDTTHVLESDIEIIAQPPGKSLQNMQLLSGGERALTAIAILFSILHMKPSPFCILDEIEAALDDANVTRYAAYLTKFSKETQFIVITHRKGTMEYADIMYGVTMQEKGVSKLLSVNFAEQESVLEQ